MGLLKVDRSKLVEEKVKTTPQNVKKLTFWEYLKYHPRDYVYENLSS